MEPIRQQIMKSSHVSLQAAMVEFEYDMTRWKDNSV